MTAREISSLQHPLVKYASELRCDRAARESGKQVLISGKKNISDLSSAWPIDTLFFHGARPDFPSKEAIHVTEPILRKITGLEQPDGWAAIVPMPAPRPLSDQTYLLILDRVSDPGNLGTLWRTALGLGWDGIWLLPGCVDPFNDKALRAAKGASSDSLMNGPTRKEFPLGKCSATLFSSQPIQREKCSIAACSSIRAPLF